MMMKQPEQPDHYTVTARDLEQGFATHDRGGAQLCIAMWKLRMQAPKALQPFIDTLYGSDAAQQGVWLLALRRSPQEVRLKDPSRMPVLQEVVSGTMADTDEELQAVRRAMHALQAAWEGIVTVTVSDNTDYVTVRFSLASESRLMIASSDTDVVSSTRSAADLIIGQSRSGNAYEV